MSVLSLAILMIALAGIVYAEPSGVEFEPTPANPHPVISTDLDLIKEELEYLQEETVSIAISHEQPISEAPSNVYVITEEDIRHSGATDIPTILRRIPGMEIIQVTSADFDVSTRGDNQLQQNKLLILVDGRSIYFDIQGQVWWKSIPVTLPEIKKIEVLKGPASVLYGFNAFDAVINIITKQPNEMKGATLQAGGGTFDTVTTAAIYANKIERLGYRFSAGYDQNDKWTDHNSLGFRNYKLNGQIGYELADKSNLVASGGYWNTDRFDGQIYDFVRGETKINNGHASLLYERPNFFIRTWWQNWNQETRNTVDPRIDQFISIIDGKGSPTVDTRHDSYNVETQHDIDLWAENRFTYGVNYRYNTGSSNFLRGSPHENRLGVYIQDEWNLTNSLKATSGVRLDIDTFINPTYSPRGSLLYRFLDDHTFRASVSIAYRPPTIFETHAQSNSLVFFPGIPPFVPPSVTPGQLIGSKNLEPEKIVSYQLGYQGWYIQHRARLRADLFFNRIKNLIGRTRISQTPSVLSFVNDSGTADIYGFEIGADVLFAPWLNGFLNYSYQDITKNFNSADDRRGAPHHKINAGLRGEWDNGLSGEATFHYVSSANYPVSTTFSQFAGPPFGGPPAPSTKVDSYSLVNLRGAYRFLNDRAEVAVTAFNALNDKHKEHPLGEIIKSRVMGWLTLKY